MTGSAPTPSDARRCADAGRPWEKVAPGEWWATSPRQLTGTPYAYHGYVTRDRKRAERLCCDRDHRSPEAAKACADRTARRLNRGLMDVGR